MLPNPFVLFVVDDDADAAFIVKKAIEYDKEIAPFFRVYSFTSGDECLAHLHLNPAVIILDYYLKMTAHPMNGHQVLAAIREQGHHPRVIMLSGQDDGQVVLELIQEGVRDYVEKGESAYQEIKDVLLEFLENSPRG